MVEYLVAGHSHIFAMGAPQGYSGPLGLLRTPDELGYFIMEEWKGDRSQEYWETLIENSQNRAVFLSYSGNQHHSKFLITSDLRFDIYDEFTEVDVKGARLVPRRLIEALFSPTLDGLRLMIQRLLAARCLCVRLIGTPPPPADLHLFNDMTLQSAFAQQFAQLNGVDLANASLAPAVLVLKLWRIVQQLIAQEAIDSRVKFVAVPPEGFDSGGFLAKQFYEYYPGFETHGNYAFGQMMLRRALQSLEE